MEKPRFPSVTEEERKERAKAFQKQREAYDAAAKLARKIIKDEKYISYRDAYINAEKMIISDLIEFAKKEPDNNRFANIARTNLARLDVLWSLIAAVEDDLNKNVLIKE